MLNADRSEAIGGPGAGLPSGSPVARPKGDFGKLVGTGCLVSILLGAGMLFLLRTETHESTPRPDPAPRAGSTRAPSRDVAVIPVVADPPGTFRDGTKVVGKDIKPGTYRTRARSPGCYWARLAGFSGEMGDVLTNGNESGPVIVTIGASDKGFESAGCGLWTPDLSAITDSPEAPFGDGVFLVGVDVAPGVWQADACESCYWARLRGFSGGMGDIIANDNGKGIVTIRPTDKGFASLKCGTWTRAK